MAVFGNVLLICSFYLLCFMAVTKAEKEKKSLSKERSSLARDPRQTVIPNPNGYSCPVTQTFYDLEVEATNACQYCPRESCCRCQRRRRANGNGNGRTTRCINKRRICNAILAIFLDNNRARCTYETSYDCCEAKLLLQKLIYQINSFCPYAAPNGAAP